MYETIKVKKGGSMRCGWIIGESERLTKARKASWATACAFLQDVRKTGNAKAYLRDCLDTVFSDLVSLWFPLVSASQSATANLRRRWFYEEHHSKCEGEDFRGQSASLGDSYRARTGIAGMVVSRERNEGAERASPLVSLTWKKAR
jgi:hypothetical protein